MKTLKITAKGQVTIPAEIRAKYGISKGTRVIVMDREGEIVIKPLSQNFIAQCCGMCKEGESALEVLLSERSKHS